MKALNQVVASIAPSVTLAITNTAAKLRAQGIKVCAFAAGEPTQEAMRKMREKGLDLIVANDVTAPGAGFAVDTNQVTFLSPNAPAETLPLMPKRQLADIIIQRCVSLYVNRDNT